MDVVGSWAFTGAQLAEYVRLLPALVRRFGLKSLVTSYPLDACDQALAAVGEASVMKAVLAVDP